MELKIESWELKIMVFAPENFVCIINDRLAGSARCQCVHSAILIATSPVRLRYPAEASLFARFLPTAAHAYAPLHLPPAARGNAATRYRSCGSKAPSIKLPCHCEERSDVAIRTLGKTDSHGHFVPSE